LSVFDVRDATAADAPGIRELFERIFKSELSAEEFRWKFERNPDGWYGVVAVLGGRIVGNYAGWGMRFQLDGRPHLLYSVGDVATDASVRSLGGRRSVYREMTEAFYARVGKDGVPFCFGFPNVRALRVSERIVGSRTLMPITLKKVPAENFGPPPGDAEAGDSVGEGFDALWEAGRRTFTHGPFRDRGRVNWRFYERPSRYYHMVSRRQGREILSWAALSIVGPEATVADYLGREADGRDLGPLFAAAAEEARRLGARTLVFWETPGGPGRAPIAALRGASVDAGFPMIVRLFDEDATRRFGERAHLVPSLYDLT
jgi:Acetyltransferase (GNAT) domain